ncbi:hypothetical protein INT48_005545 [Thamnidium elegans]|uniref:Uncharacterized protein n=1 Tax=Thamnidium elegans TaxID=101142 RepID=A0A8H7SUX9_9FUNG|nr:hypothetical protein INT48_005545 [Thamnidium elegans]
MSTLDLYNSKQRQGRQSRADLATSWRTSYPSRTSGTEMEYLRSIWTDIPNEIPSSHLSSYYGERQVIKKRKENTGVGNAVNFYDNNNASTGLISLLSSLSLYTQDEDRTLSAQTVKTEAVDEQPLLDIHTGQQVNDQDNNNPWSQLPNIVNQNISTDSHISWSQVPDVVNQEHNNILDTDGNHTWSQVVASDTEEGLDSSGTLIDAEDTMVDKDSNHTRAVRYISESFFTASLNGTPVFTDVPPPRPYMVLKIQNANPLVF